MLNRQNAIYLHLILSFLTLLVLVVAIILYLFSFNNNSVGRINFSNLSPSWEALSVEEKIVLLQEKVGSGDISQTDQNSILLYLLGAVDNRKKQSRHDQFDFQDLSKNWSKLDDIEKAKLVRKSLGEDPNAWRDNKGNIPNSVYLKIVMNPFDRDLMRDYLLLFREKIWRNQIASLLTEIVWLEFHLEYLQKSSNIFYNQIKLKAIRKNQPLSQNEIENRVSMMKKGIDDKLKYTRALLKDILKDYNTYQLVLPDSFGYGLPDGGFNANDFLLKKIENIDYFEE
jgi:hypothetical protein